MEEGDVVGMRMGMRKERYEVRGGEELGGVIKEGFEMGRRGRAGGVLIDIGKDVGGIEGRFE